VSKFLGAIFPIFKTLLLAKYCMLCSHFSLFVFRILDPGLYFDHNLLNNLILLSTVKIPPWKVTGY
jgi:hypothetical protein